MGIHQYLFARVPPMYYKIIDKIPPVYYNIIDKMPPIYYIMIIFVFKFNFFINVQQRYFKGIN